MELRDYWRILAAHRVGVLIIVAATVALAGLYTWTQPKVYAANASGFVSSGASLDPASGSINDSLAKSRVTSYVDIATSRPTAQDVIDDLGLDVSPSALVGNITVEQPLDTVSLKVTARSGTPMAAQQLADAWVRAIATQVQKLEDPSGKQADGTLRVVPFESAALPSAPVSPNPPRNLMLGATMGLLLGFVYARIRNSGDRRLRTKEGVEEQFSVNVVGQIPSAPGLDRAESQRTGLAVGQKNPSVEQASASEAFRKLRTNLMYMNVDNPPRVVVVTSPLPGDGKSTVAANLAAAVATSGEDVVLVDGDLRRPAVATSFGVAEGAGLSDVLAGRIALDDALQQAAEHPNLAILAAGSIPPNPSELLGSKSMQQLLQKLASGALVIVDAPPLLPVTDAAVLTARADGAFVVISAGRTLDDQLRQALDHLDAVDATTLGVVLNRLARRDAGAYGGYYGYAPADVVSPSTRRSHTAGGKRRARAGRAR
jgi:capsular exopolysaccharide synthesis family protein